MSAIRDRSSVVTSKPANGGHRKSGQWGWPGTVLFYPFEPVPGKPVLVRQLRGPHLRTVTVMEKAVNIAVTAALSPKSFPQSSTGRFEVSSVLVRS